MSHYLHAFLLRYHARRSHYIIIAVVVVVVEPFKHTHACVRAMKPSAVHFKWTETHNDTHDACVGTLPLSPLPCIGTPSLSRIGSHTLRYGHIHR